jgi:hypothetical protein
VYLLGLGRIPQDFIQFLLFFNENCFRVEPEKSFKTAQEGYAYENNYFMRFYKIQGAI